MKAYRGVAVFLTPALAGGEWSTSRSSRFTHGEKPLDRRLGGPQNRSGRHGENFCPYRDSKLRFLGRPARSQSLYRLRYPGSQNKAPRHSFLNFTFFFLSLNYLFKRRLSDCVSVNSICGSCVNTGNRRGFLYTTVHYTERSTFFADFTYCDVKEIHEVALYERSLKQC
jgi:hypothetical protein